MFSKLREWRRRIKQYFCKHDYQVIWEDSIGQSYFCYKCCGRKHTCSATFE